MTHLVQNQQLCPPPPRDRGRAHTPVDPPRIPQREGCPASGEAAPTCKCDSLPSKGDSLPSKCDSLPSKCARPPAKLHRRAHLSGSRCKSLREPCVVWRVACGMTARPSPNGRCNPALQPRIATAVDRGRRRPPVNGPAADQQGRDPGRRGEPRLADGTVRFKRVPGLLF
jgi:hypothetical protein